MLWKVLWCKRANAYQVDLFSEDATPMRHPQQNYPYHPMYGIFKYLYILVAFFLVDVDKYTWILLAITAASLKVSSFLLPQKIQVCRVCHLPCRWGQIGSHSERVVKDGIASRVMLCKHLSCHKSYDICMSQIVKSEAQIWGLPWDDRYIFWYFLANVGKCTSRIWMRWDYAGWISTCKGITAWPSHIGHNCRR